MNLTQNINVNYDVLAFIHLVVNTFIGGICICRLGQMAKKLVRVRVKAQYIVMTVAAVANGFAPLFFQQWPTIVSVFFSCVVLYIFWSDSYQWKHGVPAAAKNPGASACPPPTTPEISAPESLQ